MDFEFELDVTTDALEFTIDGLRVKIAAHGLGGWFVDGDIEACGKDANGHVVWRRLSPIDCMDVCFTKLAMKYLASDKVQARIDEKWQLMFPELRKVCTSNPESPNMQYLHQLGGMRAL